MQIRELINRNSSVTTIVALVLLFLALIVVFSTFGGNRQGALRSQWYYDLESGERFEDDFMKVPPFETTSGGTGVFALIYSCDDCDDDSEIAFLRKYSDSAKLRKEEYDRKMREAMESEQPMPPAMLPGMGGGMWEREQLVSRIDPIQWVPIDSMEGRHIFSEWRNACGGKKVNICRP